MFSCVCSTLKVGGNGRQRDMGKEAGGGGEGEEEGKVGVDYEMKILKLNPMVMKAEQI